MDINDVEMQIAEKQEAVSAFEDEAGGVRIDLKKKEKLLAETMLRSKDKSRKPAALQIQKKAVLESRVELEGIESVLETLAREIADLEVEKSAAELYQGQGQRFQEAIKSCEEGSKKLGGLSQILQSALNDFSSGVNVLIESTATARGGYIAILQNLPEKFSLRDFQKGVLSEAGEDEATDRETLVTDLNERLLALSQIPDPSDEGVISTFLESARKLGQWRLFMLKTDINAKHSFTYRKDRKNKIVHRAMQPSQFNRFILANPEKFAAADVRKAKAAIEKEGAAFQTQEGPIFAKAGKYGERN